MMITGLLHAKRDVEEAPEERKAIQAHDGLLHKFPEDVLARVRQINVAYIPGHLGPRLACWEPKKIVKAY